MKNLLNCFKNSQRKLIDMKDLYREETNKDVYAEDCCMQPSSSYSDEYVHWLEAKLRQYNVIESLSQDNFCKVCNLPTDGEKCYSKRCPV